MRPFIFCVAGIGVIIRVEGYWYKVIFFVIIAHMAKRNNKRKRKMIKRMITLIPFFVAVILIVIIAAVSFKTGIWEKYSYSNSRADLSEYFMITDEDEAPLLINDKYEVKKAYYIDGSFYIEDELVKEYIDANFYYNENAGTLMYTTGRETLNYNEGSDYIVKSGTVYINTKLLNNYADVTFKEYELPNRIEVIYEAKEWDSAKLSKDTQCRIRGGIKSDVLTDLKKDDEVYVLSAMDEWTEVKTADGFIGYVENKYLGSYGKAAIEPETARSDKGINHNLYADKICLGWHQVFSPEANSTIDEVLARSPFINVISPTWMTVADADGSVTSLGDSAYVEKAHAKGIKVWGLIDNFLEDVKVYDVLSDNDRRQHLISDIIDCAKAVNMDGVNVDFENLNVEIGPHFAQFIRELSLECHKNGLVLSVDNYVPQDYTAFYHREVQGEFGDYVIIMGYDEHYAGSAEAGSVASFDYVSGGIERTLEQVDASQVINAIPFYTRIWHEGANLESDAVGMNEAESYVNKMGGTVVWDEGSAQNYAEFNDENGNTCKVWLEDEKSINTKLSLMQSNNLAGVAFWKLGLEKESVWEVIGQYLLM